MNYQTHKHHDIDTNMSSLKGQINCSYDALVEFFGLPYVPAETKLDVAWDIEFEDGTVATIYNWKNGKRYLGNEGLALDDIREWNVGGFDKKAVEYVKNLVM